ncbi:GGDEF domain-containing protein [Acidovorax sp. SRB_14]|uniref:sensor domain-containing protein n=1 Tax=Acidovorax sp. SRB_14 TaxID=1962699 RepID=UPI001565BD59|nr:GGDEF domain-containing protein [Acidovorax sp. SRB_14]
MALSVALAIGLLALLALALSALPVPALLHASVRTRLAIGLTTGLVTTANMVLPALHGVMGPVTAPPVGSAIAMLVFGPVAGLASAATVLLFHCALYPATWTTGFAILATTALVAFGSHRLRARHGPLLALGALAAALPLALQAGIEIGAGTTTMAGALSWLEGVPWRFAAAVLVLGGGVELVLSRAQTVQALQRAHHALQRSEQETLLTLEAARGGRWEWNVEAQTLTCHGRFYDAFDVHRGGASGQAARWDALRHPEDAGRMAGDLQRSRAGLEDAFSAEFRLRDTHGRWRWLVSRGAVAERDAQGRALRLIGMAIDVTDYRDLESALHTSQAKYTAVYETMPDAAGIMRVADGHYLEVNPAFCQLLGHPREQVVGRTAQQLGIWATEQEGPKLLQALQRDGKVERLPLVAQRRGVRIPGLMSAQSVHLNDEDCVAFAFRDMTEETRIHDTLLSRNSLLQQAGRLARLGAWDDVRGQGIAYWSDVCYDIHGLPSGAPLPRDYIAEYVAPAWRDALRDTVRASIRQSSDWSMEIEIVRADGRPVWVRLRGEPVVEAGRVVRIRGVILDIDESKRAEQLLRQSEERFVRIFQLLPYPMGLTRRGDGRYVDVNAAWEQALGYTRAEAIGQSAISLGIYTPEGRSALIDAVQANGRLESYEAVMTLRSGEQRTVLQSMRATEFDGEPCWLFALHDITERKRSEEQVREREELLSLTISAASLGLWDWNLQTGLVTGDSRWRAMRGMKADSEAGTPPVSWTAAMGSSDIQKITAELARHTAHPATPFDATVHITHPREGGRWVRALGKIVNTDAAGQPLRMVGVGIDVTSQREQEERLQRLAHYDALTGLPNRVLLARRLEEAMVHARSRGTLLGVAYLDLDSFKPVNDRFGHEAGDRLLVVAAARLTRALRSLDCVARLGGDEFVILLPDLADGAACERALRTVMQSIAAPYTLDTERVTVTASIGYTLYPQDDADADALLRHADHAMYAAKQAGRNRYHQFDAAHERATQQVQEQLVQLRAALADGEFTLFLQPKVDMRLGTVVGAEALARWQHPERGLLSPAAFLPLLHDSELEFAFGAWVVDAALALIRALGQAGLQLPVSINIAAPHLQQSGFADWMAQQLDRHPGVPARLLEIEITETAALYHIDSVATTLRALRELGILTSLDDFGTGYSSLTYLRRLPLSMLKIDQSFVHGMVGDAGDLAIVQGVVGLARSFGYRVIAEGVETVGQGQMLLDMGCPLAQGYAVARPMPLADFIAWAAQWQSPPEWQYHGLPEKA